MDVKFEKRKAEIPPYKRALKFPKQTCFAQDNCDQE